MVVVGHLLDVFEIGARPFLHTLIYSFHMSVFFFISGSFATASHNKHGFLNNIRTKGKKLLVPFIVWNFLTQYILFEDLDVVHCIIDGVGRYWFLLCLFLIFAICSLSYSAYNKHKIAGYITLAILCIGSVAGFKLTSIHTFHFVYSYIPAFFVGVCWANSESFKSIMENKYTVAFCAVLWGACLMFYNAGDSSMTSQISKLLCGLSSLPVCLFISRHISENVITREITYIGRNTMPIFLIHYFFVLNGTTALIPTLPQWNILIQLCLLVPYAIIISYVSIFIYKITRKIKVLSFILYGEHS